MIVEVRSLPMTQVERATWPEGDLCPICHRPISLMGRKMVRCADGTICHRQCSQQVYIAGVGWRYVALPYPATWHDAAYDAAQAARIAAHRAGASPAEARAAGEAAYRLAWQTCCRLAPAA